MTHYDFWFAPIGGTQFCCTIAQHDRDYRECLKAATLTWEALAPFGDAQTRHPTTGETPEEFRAKRLKFSAGDLYSRMKPSMLAEFYLDLDQLAKDQEGAALVETRQIADIIYIELVLSVGAKETRELIALARAKNA